MTADTEPEGPAIGELVMILAKSIRNTAQIKAIATTAGLMGKVAGWGGDARAQWPSVLDAAKDRPAAFDEVIKSADDSLKDTIFIDEFRQWRSKRSQRGPAQLGQAIADVRQSRASLLGVNDPRRGQLHLRAMRSSIIEIKETIEAVPDPESSPPLILATVTEEVTGARSQILSACDDALREVDQLTIDIAEARRQSARVRQESGGTEAFTAERSMVRHLLNDRGLVDTTARALLEVVEQKLAQLGLPVSAANFTELPVSPQQDASH